MSKINGILPFFFSKLILFSTNFRTFENLVKQCVMCSIVDQMKVGCLQDPLGNKGCCNKGKQTLHMLGIELMTFSSLQGRMNQHLCKFRCFSSKMDWWRNIKYLNSSSQIFKKLKSLEIYQKMWEFHFWFENVIIIQGRRNSG